MIVEPSGTVEGERPQVDLKLLRPVKKGVLHHYSRLFGYGLNVPLGDPTLVVCAGSGKGELLVDQGIGEVL